MKEQYGDQACGKLTSRRTRIKTTKKRIVRVKGIICTLAVFFVALSFTGFYLSSMKETKALHVNLIKLILVLKIILILVFWELLKQEKSKLRYATEYTIRATRK